MNNRFKLQQLEMIGLLMVVLRIDRMVVTPLTPAALFLHIHTSLQLLT